MKYDSKCLKKVIRKHLQRRGWWQNWITLCILPIPHSTPLQEVLSWNTLSHRLIPTWCARNHFCLLPSVCQPLLPTYNMPGQHFIIKTARKSLVIYTYILIHAKQYFVCISAVYCLHCVLWLLFALNVCIFMYFMYTDVSKRIPPGINKEYLLGMCCCEYWLEIKLSNPF